MLVCFLLVFVSLPVGAQDERWDALKNLTRKRDYTILKRDRQCVDGEIAAVTDHNLTVKHFRQWDKPPHPREDRHRARGNSPNWRKDKCD